MSDVKLNDAGVIVEGAYLAVHGASFELKDAARFDPSRSRGHQRKTLVHETDDRLVMNHSNDYRGVVINGSDSGVELNGDVRVRDDVVVRDLDLEKPVTASGSGSGSSGGTKLGNVGSGVNLGAVLNTGIAGRVPGAWSNDVSLRWYLQETRKQINALTKRVAELEARHT